MARMTLLTNILPPYRIGFLNELARLVELTVVVNSVTTPDRSWVIDTATLQFDLLVEGGLARRVQRLGAANHTETRYVHIANRTIPILSRTMPDVVVSAELGLRTAQAMVYARWQRVPVICYWEGTGHTESSISATRGAWRKLLVGAVDGAWVNGVESRDYLLGLGVASSAMTLDMTGVDTRFFRAEAERLLPARAERRQALGLQGLVFAYCGALSSRKGIAQFLDALTNVASAVPHSAFSVLFIGDGDQRALVENWSSTHPSVAVHVTGFVQLAELPKFYACADWFVLPTLEDCWALATLEPLAFGLPQVFSTYNGASADLVQFPGAGIVADPLDIGRFTAVLLEVLRQGPRPVPTEVVQSVVDKYSPVAHARRAAGSAMQLVANARAMKRR